jgi:SAM-dependent methyltransferase
LPDLRLAPDRYLDLASDRAKAERLHALEPNSDVMSLSEAYYGLTADVLDRRRARFLRHIAGAESRGAALVDRLPRVGRILEVGCGSGGLLAAAASSMREIVGVDIAARWLVIARRRLADRGLSVSLVAAECERLPWPDATFDVVVADSLLEHLDDPALALAEWHRVLRPGGILVIWSPNRFTLTTDPHLGLWGLGWLPRRYLPGYVRLRRRDEWPPRTLSAREARRQARACGLDRVTIGPPTITDAWAQSRPALERISMKAYAAARRLPGAHGVLTAIGPLWELRAEARKAA